MKVAILRLIQSQVQLTLVTWLIKLFQMPPFWAKQQLKSKLRSLRNESLTDRHICNPTK